MQLVQTAGVPPNQGRMNRAIMGCAWKSRNALVKIAQTKALKVQESMVCPEECRLNVKQFIVTQYPLLLKV